MKAIVTAGILCGLLMAGCKEGIDIQVEPFRSAPVIYCLIDRTDTIHSIRIERVFSGQQPPALTAGKADSLFFSEAEVWVRLTGSDTAYDCKIQAEMVDADDKLPGYFGNEKHCLYQFRKKLTEYGYNLYDSISVIVTIPGMPVAVASCHIIDAVKIWSPNPKGQFVYIVPDRPLLIQWSGGSWNELDIRFEIREMYADTVLTKSIHFQKVNNVHVNGKYYEIQIPYELVVQEISKRFVYRKDIIRRYFGKVMLSINTGQEEYARYMQYNGGINDFNQNPFSNFNNAFGLLTSKSSVALGPMDMDQESRFRFAEDPILKKLSFIEY